MCRCLLIQQCHHHSKKLIECERIHLTCAVLLLNFLFRFFGLEKKMPNNLFFFFKKASSFIIIICVYAVNTCFFQVVDYVLLPEAFIWLRQSIITEEKKNSFHRLVIFRARHKVKSKWRTFFFLFRRMKCDRTHPDFFFLLSYLW